MREITKVIFYIFIGLILLNLLDQSRFMFRLKSDEVCLEAAKLELHSQLGTDKYNNCFTLQNIIDYRDNGRRFRWIKTWKNTKDTISVYVFVERDYWGERYSYIDCDDDLYQKLNIVDLKDGKKPTYNLTDKDKAAIKKYQNYKLCE